MASQIYFEQAQLPIVTTTTVVAAAFALTVLLRYLRSRQPYLLAWTIGLSFYGLAALLQSLSLAGVSGELLFRLWYLTAVVLVLAYQAAGVGYLLVPSRWTPLVTATVSLVTVLAALLALLAPLRTDVAVFAGGSLHAKVPATLGTEDPQSVYGGGVPDLTFVVSFLAGLVLIGGALVGAMSVVRTKTVGRTAAARLLVVLGTMVPQDQGLAWLVGMCIAYVGLLLAASPPRGDRGHARREPAVR